MKLLEIIPQTFHHIAKANTIFIEPQVWSIDSNGNINSGNIKPVELVQRKTSWKWRLRVTLIWIMDNSITKIEFEFNILFRWNIFKVQLLYGKGKDLFKCKTPHKLRRPIYNLKHELDTWLLTWISMWRCSFTSWLHASVCLGIHPSCPTAPYLPSPVGDI